MQAHQRTRSRPPCRAIIEVRAGVRIGCSIVHETQQMPREAKVALRRRPCPAVRETDQKFLMARTSRERGVFWDYRLQGCSRKQFIRQCAPRRRQARPVNRAGRALPKRRIGNHTDGGEDTGGGVCTVLINAPSLTSTCRRKMLVVGLDAREGAHARDTFVCRVCRCNSSTYLSGSHNPRFYQQGGCFCIGEAGHSCMRRPSSCPQSCMGSKRR